MHALPACLPSWSKGLPLAPRVCACAGRAHPTCPQVELNTIASSFGCLSTLVARMHRYLLGRLGASPAELAALPEHNAMDGIVDAMGAAAADYGVPGGWEQLRSWGAVVRCNAEPGRCCPHVSTRPSLRKHLVQLIHPAHPAQRSPPSN